jgi:hypothetical protein
MNWPEYQRSTNACARLLGAAYCHELLESKPTLEIQHLESFENKRKQKAELRELLDWLVRLPGGGQASSQAREIFQRALLAYYVGWMLENEFETKLEKWGNKMLRSVVDRMEKLY